MPFVDDNEPPTDEPHLGLLIKDGTMVAIPKGATMALIMDPSRLDGITPMVLTKVALKSLTFRCACGNPKCSRVLKYTLSSSGQHPYLAGR